MNSKYIFIDIDGTLFDHESKCIPQSAITAIKQARKNGHYLFLCTGRGLAEVGNDFNFLPFHGQILSCGANIIVENKNIFFTTFPQQDLKYCLSFMIKHHIGFSLDGREKTFLNKDAYSLFQNIALKKANNDSELAKIILNENKMFHFSQMQEKDYGNILKISIFSKNKDACQTLIHSLPVSLTGFLKSEGSPLIHGEISINGINKASGIQHVLDYYHTDKSNSIAIGDSINDLEMMKFAGLSICMGNGDDIVKKSSDFITKSISNNGLAYAFSTLKII